MIEIVTGDDVQVYATLKKDDQTFEISGDATVTAMLVSLDRDTQLTSGVAQSAATAGADWDNSVVAITFTSAQTSGIAPGRGWLELQVNDGGKTTWFLDVDITKGNIA